eukprot:754770-Hanusia_phi.AAC.1
MCEDKPVCVFLPPSLSASSRRRPPTLHLASHRHSSFKPSLEQTGTLTREEVTLPMRFSVLELPHVLPAVVIHKRPHPLRNPLPHPPLVLPDHHPPPPLVQSARSPVLPQPLHVASVRVAHPPPSLWSPSHQLPLVHVSPEEVHAASALRHPSCNLRLVLPSRKVSHVAGAVGKEGFSPTSFCQLLEQEETGAGQA